LRTQIETGRPHQGLEKWAEDRRHRSQHGVGKEEEELNV